MIIERFFVFKQQEEKKPNTKKIVFQYLQPSIPFKMKMVNWGGGG